MATDNKQLALRSEIPAEYQIQLSISNHPIVWEYGLLRYKQTDFSGYDFGKVWADYEVGKMTLAEIMQLYRNTGTSLYYFADCFAASLKEIQLEQVYKEPVEDVYNFWQKTKTGTWSELYELIAEDLAKGNAEAVIEEAIAVLRCAAWRERYALTEKRDEEPDHR